MELRHEIDVYQTETGVWEWDCPEAGVSCYDYSNAAPFASESDALLNATAVLGGGLYR